MDHHGGPVVAKVGPLGDLGLGPEDLLVAPGDGSEFVEGPGATLPEDLVRVFGEVPEDLLAEVGALGEGPVEAGGV